MIIQDAIRILRNSNLKNLKVGEDETALVDFINMGVLELHKRFRLSFGEAVITPVTGKTVYKLDGTDTDVDIDLDAGELLLIEFIIDADDDEVSLNKLIDPNSTKTTSYNTIKFGPDEDSTSYTVVYRTSPPFSSLLTTTIPLSSVFLDSLFHYVSYQAFLSVNGEENTQHNLHRKRFEDSILRIVGLGLYDQSDVSTDKLSERGFY